MNKLDKKRTGTSFKGYVYVRYDQLIALFNEPRVPEHSDNKIDVEWIIDTPYGVATVYNYKDGKNYMGKAGLRPDQIFEWHVGGKNLDSYNWLRSKVYQFISDQM